MPNKAFLTTSILSIIIASSCGINNSGKSQRSFPVKSYLNLEVDSNGRLPSNPYTLTFSHGNKQIVFCGTNHVDRNDTSNPMYKEVERQFRLAKPQACINEGRDLSNFKYNSKSDAISKYGEIGLAKVMSDSARIRTISGDMPDNLELEKLIHRYGPGKVIAYITVERLMWSLKSRNLSFEEIVTAYERFVNDYFITTCGLKLNESERSFAFFSQNYEDLLKRPFDIQTLESTNPFDSVGVFQAIGRSSKEIRDQHLLETIDNQLKDHDRVFVVFGGWHLLVCEPGLKEIIDQYKN